MKKISTGTIIIKADDHYYLRLFMHLLLTYMNGKMIFNTTLFNKNNNETTSEIMSDSIHNLIGNSLITEVYEQLDEINSDYKYGGKKYIELVDNLFPHEYLTTFGHFLKLKFGYVDHSSSDKIGIDVILDFIKKLSPDFAVVFSSLTITVNEFVLRYDRFIDPKRTIIIFDKKPIALKLSTDWMEDHITPELEKLLHSIDKPITKSDIIDNFSKIFCLKLFKIEELTQLFDTLTKLPDNAFWIDIWHLIIDLNIPLNRFIYDKDSYLDKHKIVI